MDSYLLGYKCGRIATRLLFYYSGTNTAIRSYWFIDSVARARKINSNDPSIVSENLFKCLEYLDW